MNNRAQHLNALEDERIWIGDGLRLDVDTITIRHELGERRQVISFEAFDPPSPVVHVIANLPIGQLGAVGNPPLVITVRKPGIENNDRFHLARYIIRKRRIEFHAALGVSVLYVEVETF
jgi:hypothetical protein